MDLQLSRKGDYAVRAAIALARGDGAGYTKIREVSQSMGIPLPYTAQILKILANAGFAEAKAGREGGYRLKRDAPGVTLLEIIESVEGSLKTRRCTLRGEPCVWESPCPVHHAWVAASEALRHELAQTTLADIARADAERADDSMSRDGSASRGAVLDQGARLAVITESVADTTS